MGQHLWKAITQQDEVSGKLIKQCCTKETQAISRTSETRHSGLETGNHTPLVWEELDSQDPRLKLPQNPGLRPLPALPNVFLIVEKEPILLLHTFGSQGKLWIRPTLSTKYLIIPRAKDSCQV